ASRPAWRVSWLEVSWPPSCSSENHVNKGVNKVAYCAAQRCRCQGVRQSSGRDEYRGAAHCAAPWDGRAEASTLSSSRCSTTRKAVSRPVSASRRNNGVWRAPALRLRAYQPPPLSAMIALLFRQSNDENNDRDHAHA